MRRDDVRCSFWGGADAILLPKVNTPRDIDNIGALIDKDMPIWAMMETAQGVLNAAQIAAHPRLRDRCGTNDLIHELGVLLKMRFTADEPAGDHLGGTGAWCCN